MPSTVLRVRTRVRGLRDGAKRPWREAGPPDHLNDEENLDQQVVNKTLCLSGAVQVYLPPTNRTHNLFLFQVYETAPP
jgi:hypothetical protein